MYRLNKGKVRTKNQIPLDGRGGSNKSSTSLHEIVSSINDRHTRVPGGYVPKREGGILYA